MHRCLWINGCCILRSYLLTNVNVLNDYTPINWHEKQIILMLNHGFSWYQIFIRNQTWQKMSMLLPDGRDNIMLFCLATATYVTKITRRFRNSQNDNGISNQPIVCLTHRCSIYMQCHSTSIIKFSTKEAICNSF